MSSYVTKPEKAILATRWSFTLGCDSLFHLSLQMDEVKQNTILSVFQAKAMLSKAEFDYVLPELFYSFYAIVHVNCAVSANAGNWLWPHDETSCLFMLSAHVASAGLQTGHENEHCIQQTQCGENNPSSNPYLSSKEEKVSLRKFSPFLEKFLMWEEKDWFKGTRINRTKKKKSLDPALSLEQLLSLCLFAHLLIFAYYFCCFLRLLIYCKTNDPTKIKYEKIEEVLTLRHWTPALWHRCTHTGGQRAESLMIT